jgi:nitrogen fixation NifU-like protein
MMTALVKGTERSEAIRLADVFTDMMHDSEDASPDKSLGDLRALQGVSKFPVRIRCALLAFDALRNALGEGPQADSVGKPDPVGGAAHSDESGGETTH